MKFSICQPIEYQVQGHVGFCAFCLHDTRIQ